MVLHIPQVGWGVIDSCEIRRDGLTSVPPLEYLQQFSVQRLAFAVLTHLHEDHFLGMEKILDAFEGNIGIICRYGADGVRELKRYWAKETYLGGRDSLNRASSLFHAMHNCKKSGARKLRLSENTIVLEEHKSLPSGKTFQVIIKALTPSAESVDRYTKLLFENLRPGQPVQKLPDRSHNLVASALWISVGSVRFLLGSDVETGTDDQTGWRGVVNSPWRPDLRAHSLKVAHHGSENAHYPPAWELHAHKNLISLVTPFSGSNPPLPRDSDIKRIRGLSRRVGVTSKIILEKPDRHYSREVSKRMAKSTLSWKVKKFSSEVGFLRLRYNLDGDLIEETAVKPSIWLDGSEKTLPTN